MCDPYVPGKEKQPHSLTCSVSRVSLVGYDLTVISFRHMLHQARVRTRPDHDSYSGLLLCTAPTDGPGATGSYCTAPWCDELKCGLLSQSQEWARRIRVSH